MEGPLKLPKLNNRDKDDQHILQPRYDPHKKTFRHRAGQLPVYAHKDKDDAVALEQSEIRDVRRVNQNDSSEEEEYSDGQREKRVLKKLSNISQFLDFDSCLTEGLKKRSRAGDHNAKVSADDDIAEEMDGEFSSSMSESDEERNVKLRAKKSRSSEQELGDSLFDEPEVKATLSSSDDSDEQEEPTCAIKPVFKLRSQRTTTIHTTEADEAEIKNVEENIKARQEESLRLMKEKLDAIAVKEEEKSVKEQMGLISVLGDTLSDSGLLDEDDEVDENQAYEEWKQRELGRLVRDELKRIARLKEEQETENRRNMTEEDRLKDDLRIEAENAAKTVKQGKMMFMQKYYHSGAFFQNVAGSGEERVFMKDFNAPVPEDAIDKTLLPKAMRVRRGEFGRKGRSKHTHLADVDTTDWTSPWTANRKRKEDTKGSS